MTKGSGDRFRLLSRLFDEVVELPADQRDAAIVRLCDGDGGLELELRALVSADETADPDAFVAGVVASEAAAVTSPRMQGTRLGSWRVAEPLGEGGMGTVYRAHRDDGAYDAQAALKLVRGGIPSPALSARFIAERQILAGLSHPGIARLLDGGNAPDGTPFLVMELVDGRPITDWCDNRDLGVEERIRLFLEVCDSVGYAHGALVAHRDLKPSNILVSEAGEPKLLDFGIAKLMDAVSEGSEGVTQVQRALTPSYASPEQVAGARAGVAADVYSLGVLLYELLSGRLPIETRGLTPAEVISRVTEDVPPVMSSVTPDDARRRRVSGDLDAIVSRALRKEPEERYASVEALADDLRLHLDGLPIKARRDDRAYRIGKMVRRNRGVVSGGLLMALLLISFTGNAILQARAVGRERDRAEAQRETAERVSGFLEELLTEADPNESSGQDVTAREVLDRGASRVMAGMATEPEIQASLATVMGRVYRRLGEYGESGTLLDSALAVRRGAGLSDLALAQALVERSALAYDEGDYESSLELGEEARSVLEAVAPGDRRITADAISWISAAQMELGQMEEAAITAREVVEMSRRLDPDPNEDLVVALSGYCDVLRGMGDYEGALSAGQEALAMARVVYGNEHLQVAHTLNQLASTLSRAGRAPEAVSYVEEGLGIRRAVFPGDHVETAASLGNLANVYNNVGRTEEALAARTESLAMIQAIFPGSHPYVAASLNSMGQLLLEHDRREEAEPLLVEAVDMHREIFPPAHPNLGFPLTNLGRLYLAEARFAEAEGVLREAYEARSSGLPAGHWYVAASGLDLGRALEGLGRDDEAETYLVESHDILRDEFGVDDSRTEEARVALREHLLRRGFEDRAGELTGEGD